MKSNIVLVGLDYIFVKKMADNLSASLDMFYLDIEDLIRYNFKDEEDTISKVGYDYYNKQIKKLVFSASTYENTIINCPYDLLLNNEIWQKLKQSATIVFVDIPKAILTKLNDNYPTTQKIEVQLLTYKELTKEIKSKADLFVNYSGEDLNAFIYILKDALLKYMQNLC